MDLIDRFKYLMKLNNLNASSFADEIGVQRSSMSHILSGRNKPSLEFIQKVLTRFPKVSADWLIAGITSTDKMELPKQSENNDSKTKPNSPTSSTDKAIQRILIFYNDNTFDEYTKV